MICFGIGHPIGFVQSFTALQCDKTFNLLPALRKSRIIGRQCPNGVNMVWQQNPSIYGEWMQASHLGDGCSQGILHISLA
jgi:hypothetical protein